MLIQLTYMSRAVSKHDAAVLQDILQTSRRNNRGLGITGMLVVKADKFLQALEGDADKVHRLYNTISHDPRHGGIVKIGEKSIEQRAFASWDMGFRDLNLVQEADGVLTHIDFNDPSLVKDVARINGIFRALVEQHR